MKDSSPMAEKPDPQSWNDFANCGMLWFVNRILHVFGLESEERGYNRVAEYMRDHAQELYNEIQDEPKK